jgi:DNA-directed RNA polymerase subunit M/transcription elongation factor TFIIS
LLVSKEKLQKRKIKEAKKQVKSKPRKKSKVCDYNSFRKRAQACFASQEEHESLLWKSIYGDCIPKKACALRNDLYLRAAEAVLLGDLDAHNVQPLDVLVDQNVQILPPSKDQASQLVFSELRGQLLKCMDGKLDLPACPVCKTDEFMSSCLIQVRSGDEAMGVFPQCLKCKHIVRTQRR